MRAIQFAVVENIQPNTAMVTWLCSAGNNWPIWKLNDLPAEGPIFCMKVKAAHGLEIGLPSRAAKVAAITTENRWSTLASGRL